MSKPVENEARDAEAALNKLAAKIIEEVEQVGIDDEHAMLIAQNDDPELLEWLTKARETGGCFVSSVAAAALVADLDNYALIRPLILQLRSKYTKYEPSDQVKQEIRDRV